MRLHVAGSMTTAGHRSSLSNVVHNSSAVITCANLLQDCRYQHRLIDTTCLPAFARRCLENSPPERVAFFLPQLVQSLRGDTDGRLADFMASTASSSAVFAHQLIWALQTEEEPPQVRCPLLVLGH